MSAGPDDRFGGDGVDSYRISKGEYEAVLWVHPEGRVRANLFLHLNDDRESGHEEPVELVNGPEPFIVVRCEGTGELRFYSKRAIVRLEHEPLVRRDIEETSTIHCELLMMDGSSLEGSIREFLVPEHRRLFDYLNQRGEQFLRIFLAEDRACLVNKAYIVRAIELGGDE